jgi:thioredoxin 1
VEKLNRDNFEDIVSAESGLFVIKFSSPTCGPCHTMAPVFEALDKNNPNVNVYEVDTMESPELAAHFGVRGVPFVVYCENREVLYQFVGVTPLSDLQYVINNIDDPHFRANGEFKQPEVKKTWWFEISVAVVILAFISAILLTS